MPRTALFSPPLFRDLAAGTVVFLVALPLCLGVALASNAPLVSGLLSGVIGGAVVGLLSGSHTSVSGPSPGLTAVIVAQIAVLGSFEAFLLAVVLAGMIQIAFGLARAGFLAGFFPSAVVKGLLAAVGIILVLKQIPHVLGHDADPEGDMAFEQSDRENTFSGLVATVGDLDLGAALIGLVSVAVLVAWDRTRRLRESPVPAPLVVVLLGLGMSLVFRELGGAWTIEASHRVQMPVPDGVGGFWDLLRVPDFSLWAAPAVYTAAFTLAAVASLETLMNLGAVDKIDPQQRTSPPNRELIAQGVGNVVVGLIGGLPVSSVIVRSSANIGAGAQTKRATVVHGALLLASVAVLAPWLNLVPLSCLAAVLLVTGVKLARPALVRRMWDEGRPQFLPFAATVAAIVLTDLLVGVLVGMAVSVGFILRSNVRRPLRRSIEKHLGGNVVRIELAEQVSFLNRAALARALDEVPRGDHVLLDARNTDYIDPDVLTLIRDFNDQTGPARGIEVSLLGFRRRYQLRDQTQYQEHATRELQSALDPAQVLEVLRDGHKRFLTGRRLTRNLGRQVRATAGGQHPLAVVVSCIDSRTPAELIFDLGVGDIFGVRIAGNIASREVIGSVEYGCAVAGAKLILVMGHTRCGAVTAAVNFTCSSAPTGCTHLGHLIHALRDSIGPLPCADFDSLPSAAKDVLIDGAARRNALQSVAALRNQSPTLDGLVREGRIVIVGAMYDVVTGEIEFLSPDAGAADLTIDGAPTCGRRSLTF
ncbi:bifunctional SulP family inorganic anion transporter/carbonic anhydrase [Frigoriglobus tundricola]|uniref:Na(+)-dependent bicarbonate transporter BicA n=1 Tax=Frigoriglobus tundricola TaxID=2774151 RepID=A0A6M5Z1B2_9BACT|nr:SulP family inorganic anion transporter [Frigoriglobus tundricola]QJW99430.1 Na(+)-dependent bicarbonate transporter BicA [Frigoriglobus tundricola]